MHRVTKTYGHEQGLSCCFRQWRAMSHCQHLHGYALAFKLVFEASELDRNNWVIDFGGLKKIKEWLQTEFDHKLIIANDDPKIAELLALQEIGAANVRVTTSTGCEAFAQHVYDYVKEWLVLHDYTPRVRLVGVEVSEHNSNAAIYFGDK